MPDPSRLLLHSAVLQFLFSVLLGWLMLVPRQPWGKGLQWLKSKDFTAAHLDWFMLAFMQLGAGGLLRWHPAPHAEIVAYTLIAGGWLNPVPYVLRALGVNAFSLGGGVRQFTSALLAGMSSLAITLGWFVLVVETW
jgi:hypothetical protein